MGRLRTLPEALAARRARRSPAICFVGRWRRHAVARMPTSAARRCGWRVRCARRDCGRGDLVALVIARRRAVPDRRCSARRSPASCPPRCIRRRRAPAICPRYFELTAGILRAVRRAGGRHDARARAALRRACARAAPILSLVARARRSSMRRRSSRTCGRRSTTSRSCSSRRDRRPRRKAWRSRIATCRRTSTAFNGPSGVATIADDVGVSWLPLNHDMGLVGMALGALYAGRPCVLLPPQTFVKRPAEWLRAITRHRGTVSFAPNFAYDLCVRRVKDAISTGSTCRAGAWPGAAPSRFIRRRSRRSPRSSRPPGSARPAFFRATAWPSTCWPRRSRRADAPRRTLASRDRRRVASWRRCGTPAGQLRPALPGIDPHRGRGRTPLPERPDRRDSAGRARP